MSRPQQQQQQQQQRPQQQQQQRPQQVQQQRPQQIQQLQQQRPQQVQQQAPAKPITMSQKEYETYCLQEHNKFRQMHKTPPLKINSELTQIASKWAQNLAKRQVMEHSPNGKYGENIYFSSGQPVTPVMPVKMWYDEIAKYSFEKSEFNPATGHFTQLIWRDTKEVGIAYALNGEKVWVVANYSPPGNVQGQFKTNVPPRSNG